MACAGDHPVLPAGGRGTGFFAFAADNTDYIANAGAGDNPDCRRESCRITSSCKYPINPHENAAIDTPRPIDRQTAQSWTASVRRNWPVAILAGWAAGIIILTGASIVSYLRFLQCLHATLSVEEVWVQEWEDLLARHRVRAGVPLLVTANVGPLLCLVPRGYRLIVPAGLWQRLAPEGRLSVLRHELAHLVRRDLLKSILVRLLMLPTGSIRWHGWPCAASTRRRNGPATNSPREPIWTDAAPMPGRCSNWTPPAGRIRRITPPLRAAAFPFAFNVYSVPKSRKTQS